MTWTLHEGFDSTLRTNILNELIAALPMGSKLVVTEVDSMSAGEVPKVGYYSMSGVPTLHDDSPTFSRIFLPIGLGIGLPFGEALADSGERIVLDVHGDHVAIRQPYHFMGNGTLGLRHIAITKIRTY